MSGTKTLIEGPGGTGKTHCIRTLLDAGIKPFVVFTEQGSDTLGDIPAEAMPRRYVRPTPLNWKTLELAARTVNTNSYESLTKAPSPDKAQNQQYIQLIGQLGNFVDDNGESWGAVDSWKTDRAIVIDGMTGLCRMAVRNTVGTKMTMAPPEYGVAQNLVENLLLALCNIECHFVLISHVEREENIITGGTTITVSAIGKALAPKIPPMFGEVIRAKRENSQFYWSTEDVGFDLKARLLPWNSRLTPSFVPLIEAWKAKGNTIEVTK
jgi:hypothetical protein